MRILVAEDNPDNRDLLVRRLQRQGWSVSLAEDGQEALDKCRAESPDLILMDVAMPRMSGLEATRLLRADPATSDVRIIAVTNRIECLEAGCDDYATKPVDFAELFASIRRVMGIGQQE
jgi:two-component system, cell cycle response regulator DivK